MTVIELLISTDSLPSPLISGPLTFLMTKVNKKNSQDYSKLLNNKKTGQNVLLKILTSDTSVFCCFSYLIFLVCQSLQKHLLGCCRCLSNIYQARRAIMTLMGLDDKTFSQELAMSLKTVNRG